VERPGIRQTRIELVTLRDVVLTAGKYRWVLVYGAPKLSLHLIKNTLISKQLYENYFKYLYYIIWNVK
jgi:hypothetical protein